jgi:hypothetical protein
MEPESFNPIHTAAVKVRLPNFKSSFLCVLCLFAAISGFSLSFASLREIFYSSVTRSPKETLCGSS